MQPVKIPVKEVCSFHLFFHMLHVFLKPVKTCTFIVFFSQGERKGKIRQPVKIPVKKIVLNKKRSNFLPRPVSLPWI